MDRSRYDSAMFWLPFGTAAAVIGLALMTIGLTRLSASESVWSSWWFDAGAALLAIGALFLLWSLILFLGRRRGASSAGALDAEGKARKSGTPPKDEWMSDAIRGYYRERETLFKAHQQQQKAKKKRP